MSSLTVRCARASDLPALAALSESVGFNQTAQDWDRFVHGPDAGCFVAVDGDRLAASSIGFAFGGDAGWIGMVIVNADFRRRGLGKTMTTTAIEFLEHRGCVHIGLDARAAGEGIYQRLGFDSHAPVTRWEYSSRLPLSTSMREGSDSHEQAAPYIIRDVMDDDIPAICALDHGAFGVDRASTVRLILQAPDMQGAVAVRDGEVRAVALARCGIGPLAIGPVVASEIETARLLIAHLMRSTGATSAAVNVLAIDGVVAMMEDLGFHRVLEFNRMYRGGWPTATDSSSYLACLGPELG